MSLNRLGILSRHLSHDVRRPQVVDGSLGYAVAETLTVELLGSGW